MIRFTVKAWQGYPNWMCRSGAPHGDHLHSDPIYGWVHCMGRLPDGTPDNFGGIEEER